MTRSPTPDTITLPHEDYGPEFTFTIWFLTALAGLFLALRVYCKFWRHRALWWDDYVLMASWLALVASCVILSVCVGLGFGKHSWDIPGRNFRPLLLLSEASGFCSLLAALWSKTSFATTLLRISDGWVRRFVWFVIITVNLSLGANAILQWIQCWPIQRLWDIDMPGKCLSRAIIIDYNSFAATYSGAMDIVLALLPWKIIWSLTMNKREKFGVIIAMSMGIFAGITSIMKTFALFAIASSDFIFAVKLLTLGTAEGAITIIAASVPILRPLFQSSRSSPVKFLLDRDQWEGSLPSQRPTEAVIISQPRGSFSIERLDRAQQHRRRTSSLLSTQSRSSSYGKSTESRHSKSLSDVSIGPPSGTMVWTDEISFEYHIREIQRIGQGARDI